MGLFTRHICYLETYVNHLLNLNETLKPAERSMALVPFQKGVHRVSSVVNTGNFGILSMEKF
jgi:hypothetical protein